MNFQQKGNDEIPDDFENASSGIIIAAGAGISYLEQKESIQKSDSNNNNLKKPNIEFNKMKMSVMSNKLKLKINQ